MQPETSSNNQPSHTDSHAKDSSLFDLSQTEESKSNFQGHFGSATRGAVLDYKPKS
jgi:hypothetical protein